MKKSAFARFRRLFGFAVTLSMLLLPAGSGIRAADGEGDLQVILVRPNTENVIDVQQITVTFNKAMVPLGDYEKLAQNFTIQVSPKVDCQWRWLNGSTLACQLNQALPPSNAYQITVPAGIRALDGSELKAAQTATFTTLLWRVVHHDTEWTGPDSPQLYLTFNQPMDLGSLQANAENDCGKPQVAKLGAKGGKGARAEDLLGVEYELDPTRTYRVTFAGPLGLGRNCKLRIKGETQAASGKVPSQAFETAFTTYPEFKIATVGCHPRKSASAATGAVLEIQGCDPDQGLQVHFTTPTTGKNLAGRIKTEPHFGWEPGGEGSPEYFAQNPEEQYQAVALRSPMLGASKHTVRFQGLKDRFGRALQGPTEIRVSTTDFSPILQLPDGYGVLEKDGPHQLAVSGVNTKEVDLDFYASHDPAEVRMWASYDACETDDPRNRKEFIFKSRLKRAVIPTQAQLNIPFATPLDLSQVEPGFKYGMFVGKMESARDLSGAPFTAHRVCSNVFTVVTDLGLLAKVGYYSSGIWVHSIRTGEPLKGVKVGLVSDSATIFEGVTDAEGFAEVPGAQKWDPERSKYGRWGNTEKLYVIAQTSDDFSVLPFETGRKGLDYYEFGQAFNPLRQSSNHLVHAITDRPLYKPGQKVNVKVFARHWEPRTYGLTPAKQLEMSVHDALGKEIFKKSVKLSEFGTADFGFDLDAGSPLGNYSIRAAVGSDSIGAGEFDVQVFTLPAFQVKVEPVKEQVEVGESANFRTQARYHFGGGVANAKGEFTANFTPGTWSPKAPKWESFSFENVLDLNITGYERPRANDTKQIAQGTVTTDANGDTVGGILLPNDQLKSYGKLEYGVSFKDDRGKAIGGYGSTEVFYTRFSIGLKTPKWAYEAKEEIVPEVVLLDPEEKPVAGATVELKLIHRTYKTVRRHGEGSYFYYDTRTKDREIATCSFKSAETPKGCGLKSKAAGDHYVVAVAKDPRGRVTQSSLQKYVTGKEYVGWYRENHDRIDVIPDKRTYLIGETAKLLVKNPFPAVDALITLERFGVLKQFRKKLTQGAEVISIPIDSKDYAPGFYVGVQLIQGRVSEKLEGGVDLGRPSFKMGLTSVQVTDPDTVLKVAAKADREQYEPGEKPRVSLTVSSPAGSDVTELSVAVVDEKILQLAGDYEGRYQLHDKFYHLRGGDVITSQMLSFLIGRRHFGKKGAPAGGDGDSGNRIRKSILPLAYWNPALRTDAGGKAEVQFTLPDNLTTWRVLVVATDQRHRFGFGSGTFRTAKKIMVEPALPSFLTEGDQLNARFTVFNRTGGEANVAARIKATGVDLVDGAEREAVITHDGKSNFSWKVRTPFGQKSATFEMSASAEKGRDGVRETIPIHPYASYETFANYGSTTEAKVTESLQIPEGIRPELGGLEVLMSPSLISHLDDSFRYLFNYPYTCWEQTLDRAIALGQYLRLKHYLSIPELSREPKGWAEELLGEMPKFQYENGGMAFWKPDARTVDPYLSVFTAMGMQWLKDSAVKIPTGPRDKLLSYVRGLVQGTQEFPAGYSARAKATVLAMAAHVLTQEGDSLVPLINKLYQERQNLSLFGKSLLWMAAAKPPETKPLLEGLKNEIYSAADLTSGTIQFKEQHDDGYVQILHSTTRTNCSLLSAMLLEDPKGRFVEPLVRWVIDGRKAGRWNNTQENLFCQNALARYASVYEKDLPNYSVTGHALDQTVKSVAFKSVKDKPTSETLKFTPAVVGKKSSLVLEKSGKGRLYYTARLRVAYQDVRTSPVNSGMQVTRTYLTQAPDGSWHKQGPLVKLKRGQLVKVLLKVAIPATRTQVVLDDRLPAGLEPINTALGGTVKTDVKGEGDTSAGGYSWNEDDDWFGFYSTGGFYHREMRLHAVQYFANFLGSGEFTLSYVAQAIATGEFNANPALIEQMYEPEVYGKSEPTQFVIEE